MTLANHGVATNTRGVAVEVGHADIPSHSKLRHGIVIEEKVHLVGGIVGSWPCDVREFEF